MRAIDEQAVLQCGSHDGRPFDRQFDANDQTFSPDFADEIDGLDFRAAALDGLDEDGGELVNVTDWGSLAIPTSVRFVVLPRWNESESELDPISSVMPENEAKLTGLVSTFAVTDPGLELLSRFIAVVRPETW